MVTLTIPKGLDGIPTATIPDDPAAFIAWFKSVGIKRWLANADVRNAVQGPGVSITGNLSTPATIDVSTAVSALFKQPYVLVGNPVAPAVMTDYRSIAGEGGVVSITDGGAEGTVTVGIDTNGIGNTQLRQGAAASVIGNATATLANVADIAASTDGQLLQRTSGTLAFSSAIAASRLGVSGAISATLTGVQQNNWNPTGLSTAAEIKITVTTGDTKITGILAQPDGTLLRLTNLAASTNSVILSLVDASSSAANQFNFAGITGTLILFPTESVLLAYSAAIGGWLLVGTGWLSALLDTYILSTPNNADLLQYVTGYGWQNMPIVPSGTFTGTLTGCTTSPTGACYYAIAGKVCTLFIAAVTGTSNTTAMTITGLPAACQPTRTQLLMPPLDSCENGGAVVGTISMQVTASSGTITFLLGNSSTGFGNTLVKGVATGFTVSYLLN